MFHNFAWCTWRGCEASRDLCRRGEFGHLSWNRLQRRFHHALSILETSVVGFCRVILNLKKDPSDPRHFPGIPEGPVMRSPNGAQRLWQRRAGCTYRTRLQARALSPSQVFEGRPRDGGGFKEITRVAPRIMQGS